MTTLDGADPPGATPLDDEDVDGLIPTFVATRGDLNVVEQANIEKAAAWALRTRPRKPIADILSATFVFDLHRRMFGDVWRWAGQTRTRGTNIGVEPAQIATQLKLVLDDTNFWHDHETFPPQERAVRLHHRLVLVHVFRNGNGRHARLMADTYLQPTGAGRLSWGAGENLVIDSHARKTYIDALRSADEGDYRALLEFALR